MAFLTHLLLTAPTWLMLVLVFALPALESSVFLGFVFPGETAVVVGGFLAANHRFSIGLALVASASGAIVGDSVGYWVGRRFGEPLLERVPTKLLSQRQRSRAVAFVQRRGAPGVVVGRFTTVLRVLVPGIAGMAVMPYRRRFLPANVLGGVLWASLYSWLGYVAGDHYASVLRSASITSTLVLVGVGVLAVGAWLWHHVVTPRRDRAADERVSGGTE